MLEAELAVLDPEDDPVEDGLTLEVGAGAAKTQAPSQQSLLRSMDFGNLLPPGITLKA